MKPNAIKSVIAGAVCLASLHSQAQNVASLNTELKGQAHPAWSSSKLVQVNPDQKLQEIYNRTSQFLRSPNRVQKMGGMDGGGGNALLCQENGKVTAELLDLYEARSLQVKLELGGKTEMLDIIDYTLNRLSKVSPLRAAVYSAMARDLLSKDTQWISNKQMPVIDDVNLSTIPQDCLLVQVAVQRPLNQKDLPNAKTYIIDSELFNLLDETSKAALVLHEVLYREARYSNVSNSLFTRHLVGLMMSPEILTYNTKKLNKLYEQNEINCFESEDTPTYIHYASEFFKKRCNFIESTNFKINSSKSVTFNFKDAPYTLTEKWSGQTGYRINTFESISSSDSSDDFNTNRSVYQTVIEFNGQISFEAQSKMMSPVKTSPIMIKNGSITTQMPFSTSNINLPSGFEAIKISPYTSSNINHYISNVVSGSADNKRTQAFYYAQKILTAEKITFADPILRLENTECDVKLESCADSIMIDVDTKDNTLEMSTYSGGYIQIYHPTANKLNVPKEFINKDGWVSARHVRFDANGKVSQYGIMEFDPPKPETLKWFKLQ